MRNCSYLWYSVSGFEHEGEWMNEWMNDVPRYNGKQNCRITKLRAAGLELYKIWRHMINKCDFVTPHTGPPFEILKTYKTQQNRSWNEITVRTTLFPHEQQRGPYQEQTTTEDSRWVWKDYIHKVPFVLHDNLQRESHKLSSHLSHMTALAT